MKRGDRRWRWSSRGLLVEALARGLVAGKGGFGDLSTLRFFVNAEPQTAFAVYDLLCSAVQGVTPPVSSPV